MLDTLLTEEELGAKLRRKRQTLRLWRMHRQGPPWIKVQGRIFYDLGAVEAWLKAKTCDPEKVSA